MVVILLSFVGVNYSPYKTRVHSHVFGMKSKSFTFPAFDDDDTGK